MTRIYVIAKAALTAVGIYTISIVLDGFGPPLLPVGLWSRYYPSFLGWLFGRLESLPNHFLTLLFMILSYQLLVRSGKWVNRLLHADELRMADDLPLFALAIYRATAVFCGAILIYYAVPAIEPLIRVHIERDKTPDYELTISILIRVALGCYLICGAPQFARWQLRKTLAFMQERYEPAVSPSARPILGKDITQ